MSTKPRLMGLRAAIEIVVKAPSARSAFRARALILAVLRGLSASVVFSALPKPTMALVIPVVFPVKVGFKRGAFNNRAEATVVA